MQSHACGPLKPQVIVYFMGGYKLETTEEERDLGVTRTSKLKPSVQCAKAARTAQMVLGQITRAFHFRDKHVFVQLYKTQLEFAIQAWSPWSQADKEFLGKSGAENCETDFWTEASQLQRKT